MTRKETDETKCLMSLSNMFVDLRTKEMVDGWIDDAKVSRGTLMDRLAIFATRNGFNPRTASDDWEAKAE